MGIHGGAVVVQSGSTNVYRRLTISTITIHLATNEEERGYVVLVVCHTIYLDPSLLSYLP
jgi:hypothetical protein